MRRTTLRETSPAEVGGTPCKLDVKKAVALDWNWRAEVGFSSGIGADFRLIQLLHEAVFAAITMLFFSQTAYVVQEIDVGDIDGFCMALDFYLNIPPPPGFSSNPNESFAFWRSLQCMAMF